MRPAVQSLKVESVRRKESLGKSKKERRRSMRKQPPSSSGKQRSETSSKGSASSHDSRKRERPGKAKRQRRHSMGNAKCKSPEERKPEGPEKSVGGWKDLIRVRNDGPENFSPGHPCSRRDGDRRNGGDGGVTKEEKRDAEKTRTPGGRGGEVFSAFCWCVGSVAFGCGDDGDHTGSNMALGMCVYSIMTGSALAMV